jgi:hypothetical protein
VRRIERWSLRVGFVLCALTGVVYGVLRYAGSVKGEFGPEPSPWQPFWQHAHVLAAPLLLFALGVAVRGHVLAMLGRGVQRGRRTGLVLAALAGPLVLGGYAVQVVTGAGFRNALGWSHAALGALFTGLYAIHWAKPRGARASE